MSLDLSFTPDDWARIERDWSAWWAGELDRPLVVIESPRRLRLPAELSPAFLFEQPSSAQLDYYEARLRRTRYFGDAWPKWWPFYGAGVLAAFLGAALRCAPEEETIWFEPAGALDIAHDHLRAQADNPVWQRIRDLMAGAAARWGAAVCVGYTDLGGTLDILSSLRGAESLLFDLYDHPQQVQRLCREITGQWLHFFAASQALAAAAGRGFTPWAPIWAPGRCYMLQCDFSAMISPAMFEQFVLPDLHACCEALDYAFYHLDGPGQLPHLDLLLALPNLHGIQWIPGAGRPEPQEWLPVLSRIRAAGKLCQLYVTRQGAVEIVRALGGRGFAFYIQEDLNETEAEEFVKIMQMIND